MSVNEDGQQIAFYVPRATPVMKAAAIYAVVVWLTLMVGAQIAQEGTLRLLSYVILVPMRVVPALELWRAFTYVLVENPVGVGGLFDALAFWWIGSPLERRVGLGHTIGFAVAGAVGGAILAVAVSHFNVTLNMQPIMGMAPITGALLIGWGFQYADQQVNFFGMGAMSGKQLTLALAAVSVVLALISFSAASFASIGGLLGGLAYSMIIKRAGGTERGSGDRDRGTRKRRPSGERFRVIQGGKDDKTMWN
jgi:membrane associated rhomboid family serine protease